MALTRRVGYGLARGQYWTLIHPGYSGARGSSLMSPMAFRSRCVSVPQLLAYHSWETPQPYHGDRLAVCYVGFCKNHRGT